MKKDIISGMQAHKFLFPLDKQELQHLYKLELIDIYSYSRFEKKKGSILNGITFKIYI